MPGSTTRGTKVHVSGWLGQLLLDSLCQNQEQVQGNSHTRRRRQGHTRSHHHQPLRGAHCCPERPAGWLSHLHVGTAAQASEVTPATPHLKHGIIIYSVG